MTEFMFWYPTDFDLYEDDPEDWYCDEDIMLADADNYGADDKGGFEWLSKSI